MIEISWDTITNMNTLYEIIDEYELTGREVADLFTCWHGAQLCDERFMENAADELGLTYEQEENGHAVLH